MWIGAQSDDAPRSTPARVWRWTDGPLDGTVISSCSNWEGVCDFTPASGAFASWAPNEPNNSGAFYYEIPDYCADFPEGDLPFFPECNPAYLESVYGPLDPHTHEWGAVTNWSSATGTWNDWAPDQTDTAGYVVEYGDRAYGATEFVGLAQASFAVHVDVAPTPTR